MFAPIILFRHLPVFIILKSKLSAKVVMGKSTYVVLVCHRNSIVVRYMGIGLSTSEVNLNRLPGWDKGSYGYHGDDGHSFCSSGSGILYGPTFTTDDYVGCCVNFLDNTCFYTRNGHNLGKPSRLNSFIHHRFLSQAHRSETYRYVTLLMVSFPQCSWMSSLFTG